MKHDGWCCNRRNLIIPVSSIENQYIVQYVKAMHYNATTARAVTHKKREQEQNIYGQGLVVTLS